VQSQIRNPHSAIVDSVARPPSSRFRHGNS
jgi:hypothetical protein